MRALISVYNKDGIVDFAKKLHELNIEIISTGGTGKLLFENNIPFTPVEKITKNKEAFGGRMKTISFEMMSSILFRRNNPTDLKEMDSLNLLPIDLVVCNLYDFNQGIIDHKSNDEMIELIDIGGPTMIRSAAKNFTDVTCLVDPSDYQRVCDELLHESKTSLNTRTELSLKAFKMTANYDLMIATEMQKRLKNDFEISLSNDEKILRYGENPHQKAKLVRFNNTNQTQTLANTEVLSGKEISYNNYLDADAAFKCASELKNILPHKCSTVIIKHGIPCGVSAAKNLKTSLMTAWNIDSTSAFGGVICFTDTVDLEIAEFFQDKFVELIIAPEFEAAAFSLLKEKKNLRLIKLELKKKESFEKVLRSINGGVLIQDEDEMKASSIDFKTVTKKDFSSISKELILFGQTVVKYKKSNCLVLIGTDQNNEDIFKIIASGVGQPNRIECLTTLISKKIQGMKLNNEILFSDAFFPFNDSVLAANELGIKYIVQPGGSIKDKDVIKTCDELNMAMMFTGVRNFRH